MAWVCEISVSGASDRAEEVSARVAAAVRQAARGDLTRLDLYEPAQGVGNDPYNPRDVPPDVLLIAELSGEQALRDLMAAEPMRKALTDLGPATVTATALQRHYYPVPGGEGATLEAPVSYVVRYRRPAEDEAAFVENYVATHPQTQAELPGIRSIICYLPVDGVARPGVPSADYMVGNEVAFDSAEAFDAAMTSPAREELREHFRHFPAFSGTTSHDLMYRSPLPTE